jgi:CAF1 family ribonuclease
LAITRFLLPHLLNQQILETSSTLIFESCVNQSREPDSLLSWLEMDYTDEWDRVTEQTWPRHLPHILQDLSDCAFVALDFEFSGIPAIVGGRQTLQERYAESKAAARKYQILQVGLTIVKEDAVAGE